jgi:simple sugar transport system permease protein
MPVLFPSINIPFLHGAGFNTGLLLAIACALIFSFILWRTTFGYSIRSIGFNIKAARYAGIKVNRTIVMVMAGSGAFAGLAGMALIFGNNQYLSDNPDGFTLGFYGIAVALLGRNTAIGSILAAILFGAFVQGGIAMQFANVDVNVIGMIQGLVIFFIGADALVRYVGNRGAALSRFGRATPETNVPAEVAPI